MKITNTFSVAGRCAETGAFGAIVTSSSPSVGARCSWVKTNVGSILTQNVTDPRLANIGFAALENGYDADAAIRSMKAVSPFPEYRQIAVVDAEGNSSLYTGKKVLGVYGEFTDKNVASIGNLLCDPKIPEAMGQTFLRTEGKPLAERLLLAIETGFEMGGELDQEHSIALLVHTDETFPYVDLRVDYSENPLEDLKKLWEVYGPQANDYKIRAVIPDFAPSYGVKGDE